MRRRKNLEPFMIGKQYKFDTKNQKQKLFLKTLINIVLKIGPDRPIRLVEPGTG